MITKNEERCIARCIRSFLPAADEIVLVDTGSNDRTEEIAAGLGANILRFKWINDFSAAKNFALNAATSDWIIFPDADDYLPNIRAAKALRAAIESKHGDKNTHGFSHTIRNFLGDGTEGSPYIDTQYCKVFRNDPNIRYQRPLHEYIGWLGESPPPLKMLTVSPDAFLFYHDGYRDDLIATKDARDLAFIDGLPRSILPATARFYQYLGRKDEARVVFERYFRSSEKDDKHTVEPHIVGVELLFSLERPYSEIEYIIGRGLEDFPEHPGMRLLAGYANYRAIRYPEALEHLQAGFDALDAGQGPAAYSSETLLESSHARLLYVLAELYALRGDDEYALYSAERALALDPRHYGALSMLAKSEPNAALAFLNERYDLSAADTLKELLPAFAANRPGALFMMLCENYFALTRKKDINYITMLAVAGEYALAVDALVSRYEATGFEPYLAKALAFALMSGQGTLLAFIAGRKPDTPYERLANTVLGNGAPDPGDLSAFVKTAHFALGFAGVTPALEYFASYAAYGFGAKALAQLALLLEKHGCYSDVLDIVDDALSGSSEDDMRAALAEAGALSAYREDNHRRAERYLFLAKRHGAHPYRLGSYAAFLAEKLSGPALERVNALSAELFYQDFHMTRPPRLLLVEDDAPSGNTLVRGTAASPQGF